MKDSINWLSARITSEHLDNNVPPEYQGTLAQDWARVAKCAEEAGEAVDALIGVTGQNPRKGYSKTWEDLYDELADVALTGIYALLHFKDDEEARDILMRRQRLHSDRMNLRWVEE